MEFNKKIMFGVTSSIKLWETTPAKDLEMQYSSSLNSSKFAFILSPSTWQMYLT